MSSDCESYCSAMARDFIEPKDEFVQCSMFSIEFEVSYTKLPSLEEEEDEEEYQINDFEQTTINETREVQRDRLINDATYMSTIQDMLFDMNIPVQDYMIHKILTTARGMVADDYYKDRKVLRMIVSIDVFVDESVSFDWDDEPVIINMVPASDSSIKQLEMITCASLTDCAICMEEMLLGSQATRMPCLHIFHGGCIVNWLEKSKYCPLCRFEMPS